MIFEVGGFTNPAAVDKQSLKVTTVSFDTNIYVIDHSDTGFDLEFTTGLITVESFLPSDTKIYSFEGFYNFTFEAQH